MRPVDISLSNLKRRKSKVAFILLGLLIGVGTIVTLFMVSQTLKSDIEKKIDEFGANILIIPKSDQLSLSYGGINISGVSYDVKELTEQDVSRIKTIKNKETISIVSPKLLGAVEIMKNQALLVGVNFKDEIRMKKWWELEGPVPKKDNELLMGSAVAQKYNLKLGSNIVINDQSFKVSSIIKETGGQDDSLVFADLSKSQQLLGKTGKVSLVEVSALCSTCPIDTVVKQISRKLPQTKVTALKQAVANREQTMSQFNAFSAIISLVVAIIGSIIVLTTTMSSVNERTREIGIFRAIGYRKMHIARIILTEIIIISLVGGIGGYLLGASGSIIATSSMSELTTKADFWNPIMAIVSVIIALFIGVAGGIYPALKAANKDPASALRTL